MAPSTVSDKISVSVSCSGACQLGDTTAGFDSDQHTFPFCRVMALADRPLRTDPKIAAADAVTASPYKPTYALVLYTLCVSCSSVRYSKSKTVVYTSFCVEGIVNNRFGVGATHSKDFTGRCWDIAQQYRLSASSYIVLVGFSGHWR